MFSKTLRFKGAFFAVKNQFSLLPVERPATSWFRGVLDKPRAMLGAIVTEVIQNVAIYTPVFRCSRTVLAVSLSRLETPRVYTPIQVDDDQSQRGTPTAPGRGSITAQALADLRPAPTLCP